MCPLNIIFVILSTANITGLNVSIKSVFPARVYATANLIALGDDDEAYVGLLTLRAYLNGSIEIIRYIETDGSMQEVFFRTGNPGTVILTFVAYNHLHGVSTNITADVAGEFRHHTNTQVVMVVSKAVTNCM